MPKRAKRTTKSTYIVVFSQELDWKLNSMVEMLKWAK